MEEINSSENIQVDFTEETQEQKIDSSQTQRVTDILVNEKAVVITNNLNIRNSPFLNGTIIDKFYFGKIVTIYAIRDYQNIINGEYNCWYKLSNTEEVWANALYIKKFPFFINSDENFYSSNLLYNSNFKHIIKINNITENNGIKYFNIIHGYNGDELEIEMDIKFSIDAYHFTILDNYYDNLYKIVNENIYTIKDKIFPMIIPDKYLIETDDIYEMPGYKVICHVMSSKYGGFIRKIEITNKEEHFICGLQLGEKRSYLEKIFGIPTEIIYDEYNELILSYRVFPDEYIRFIIENDGITSIEWETYP
jgi:hypothetical protein